MSNTYCQSSSFLTLKEEDLRGIDSVIESAIRVCFEEFKRDLGCDELDFDEWNDSRGFDYDVLSDPAEPELMGIWVYHESNFHAESAELFIGHILERLNTEEPFICMWSYTNDKPKIDHFSGGAFVAKKGKKTRWISLDEKVMEVIKSWELEAANA